jgi:hypothetical protein
MLLPVIGTKLARTCGALALAAMALLPTASARAQAASAGDSGWFDQPPSPEGTPQPYYTDPRTDAQATPTPASAPQSEVEDTDPSALTTFRPALDPYGAWVNDPTYGTVWVPNRDVVGADFAPYVSRGRWALTADNDWIWQSDYPFGWAVFHYGRWVWIGGSGWAWIPGRTYANAWVVWRVPTADYAYVGWAPMPPTWGWRYGYAFSLWYSPPLPYVFCPSVYVFDRHVHYHIVRDRHLVHQIASHSHVYPTPYRAPAHPTARTAASPNVRPARIAPSETPRGPAMSAARVPSSAVPAVRSAPPAAAARLSPRAVAPANFTREPFRGSSEPRMRVPSTRVPYDTVRRDASSYRPSSSDRVRVEPRDVSPSRVRITPSASRNLSPDRSTFRPDRSTFSPSRSTFSPPRTIAPSVRSAPIRSFSPSMPRMHGGGSFRRR